MFNFQRICRAGLGAAALALTVMGSTPAVAFTAIFGETSGYDAALKVDQVTSISTNYVQGWASDVWGADGGPTGNTNYAAVIEYLAPGVVNLRNYFVFDISSLTAPVTSASLYAFVGTATGQGTYRMFDSSSLAGQLYNASTNDSALYNALAQGTQIGSFAFNDGQSYGWVDIAFNSAGLSALNSRIANGATTFAVSGSLSAPTAPAPLAGNGLLAALATAIALLATRGRGVLRNFAGFGKLGTA